MKFNFQVHSAPADTYSYEASFGGVAPVRDHYKLHFCLEINLIFKTDIYIYKPVSVFSDFRTKVIHDRMSLKPQHLDYIWHVISVIQFLSPV